MKHFTILSILVCLSSFAGADEKIYLAATATKELLAKEGQNIVVYGETEGSAKPASGTNFVNFEKADFFLVTFKSDLDQFPDGEPHAVYDEKRIAVEGTIAIYKDKPQIKLTSPDQVTFLEEGVEFPPKSVVMEKPKVAAEAKPSTAKPEEKPAPEPEKRKPPVDAKEFFK